MQEDTMDDPLNASTKDQTKEVFQKISLPHFSSMDSDKYESGGASVLIKILPRLGVGPKVHHSSFDDN